MGDETRVQMREVKKGASAIGEIAERYLIRLLGPLGKKLQSAGKQGRLMALSGVVVILISLLLILFTSFSIKMQTKRNALVVSSKVANVRSKPSTRGKVLTKVYDGRRVSYKGRKGGWYKVRTRGKTGWIKGSLLKWKGSKSIVARYDLNKYSVFLLIGAGLFAGGILQQRGR